MIIGITNQTSLTETRAAATPQTAALFHKLGFDVLVEKNAGLKAGFSDDEYKASTATIDNKGNILKKADILLYLKTPDLSDIKNIKTGAFLIGNLPNISEPKTITELKKRQITSFALEKLPRLSRAQPFDILSSQNNLSGYRAIIEAVGLSNQVAPMMITSAGSLAPLKFLIIGVGVAGLQAIATAKRLGGKVYASDPREEVKDQVKSLGATFVDDIKTIITQCDIIITSAFSANKKAPLIIDTSTIQHLPSGAVLIDMATQSGGNIEGSKDFEIVRIGDKIIYGNSNFAAKVPFSASKLFANNLYNFINSIYSPAQKTITPDFNDRLINEICITKG